MDNDYVKTLFKKSTLNTDSILKNVKPSKPFHHEKGKEIFKANCTACHKFEKRVVGPPLAGVTQRRSPEWIMNMILNPENMVANDPDAKALLEEYLSPMANQNLTEEEARAILELFRTKN